MEKFQFEEEDIIGESTLNVIASADKFNYWMYKTIKTYCKGRVLEIGSGIGNISDFFLNDGYQLMLSDIRQGYCEKLLNQFGSHSNFMGTEVMDLTDLEFDNKFSKYFESFDTVFALNVVEHIHDDTLAIKNCKKLLKPEGHLVILVPSYQSLYNTFDKELGHYRRYTKKTLLNVFKKANLKPIHKQYFNFMGIFGWYVSGKLQKNKSIPKDQMSLYNKLVPVFKVVDKLMFNSMGLSTIVVGKKMVD